MDTKRIHGRLVEIEVAGLAGDGYIAVGIVQVGLPPEIGMRFDAKGADVEEARCRLEAEVEAYFA